MRYEKVYIGVIARFIPEGGLRPTEIIWKDGKRFTVDKIKFIERAPAKTGGLGVKRYTVIINGLEKYLYFDKENERWFVEIKLL